MAGRLNVNDSINIDRSWRARARKCLPVPNVDVVNCIGFDESPLAPKLKSLLKKGVIELKSCLCSCHIPSELSSTLSMVPPLPLIRLEQVLAGCLGYPENGRIFGRGTLA